MNATNISLIHHGLSLLLIDIVYTHPGVINVCNTLIVYTHFRCYSIIIH